MNMIYELTEFELDDHRVVTAEGKYTPPTPEVRYLSNGDPGHPSEPPEWVPTSWVVTTYDEEGEEVSCEENVPLTDDEWDTITEAVFERMEYEWTEHEDETRYR